MAQHMLGSSASLLVLSLSRASCECVLVVQPHGSPDPNVSGYLHMWPGVHICAWRAGLLKVVGPGVHLPENTV